MSEGGGNDLENLMQAEETAPSERGDIPAEEQSGGKGEAMPGPQQEERMEARQAGSRMSMSLAADTSETRSKSSAEGSDEALAQDGSWEHNEQEAEDAALRVLWQSGHGHSDPDMEYESSLEEQDHVNEVAGAKSHRGSRMTLRSQMMHEQRFQELLNDLQKENENLRTLCLTLTREKSHLARTVLELGNKVQSSSQENLSIKLQLDALRDDKRRGLHEGEQRQNIHDMTMEERAQIAEQEATQVKAELYTLNERFKRITRDNQVMADEIHFFREEVGRLRQCPMSITAKQPGTLKLLSAKPARYFSKL
ncbi:uncharacterized protein [Scyliorhinus torazame]|uniref:uncharacterized protein isoform X2 n=1 Tax=Scyliorhinus torazame TaxID=75743 RepID=UPI003B5BE67F